MQYVNDDMDEVFRRAAENYPLDTNSADWNKVLSALQETETTNPVSEKKGNKNGGFLWLLVLLPLGLICNRLYSPGNLSNKEVTTEAQKEIRTPDQNRSSNKEQTIPKSSLPSSNTYATTSFNKKSGEQKTSEQQVATLSKQNGLSRKTALPSKKKLNGEPITGSTVYNQPAFSSQQKEKRIPENGMPGETIESGRAHLPSVFLDGKEIAAVTPENRKLTSINNPFEKELKKSQTAQRRNKFYVGAIGGIDATTIKFQKIEDAGFTYGLLLGRELNKKWSIEAGYFFEKKYYYSEGKYFNTSKLVMPPNSRISEVTGNCKMIEVPVSVKYNFSSGKKSEWFATLGASSYFMKEEKYTYNYYYGSIGPVPHYKEYQDASSNLFSNISISAGYTHQLGRSSYFRAEPYLKIPVSGMGIGELPLFSTGLQVGLIKKF